MLNIFFKFIEVKDHQESANNYLLFKQSRPESIRLVLTQPVSISKGCFINYGYRLIL
jgi:hypothetical protein